MNLSTKGIVWREYQKELLAQFDELKKDGSIHIVAPPGSGKTLLGIEFARLYGGQALILVPSLALKNQWGQTIVGLYEDKRLAQSEVSFTIDEPSLITIETYQKFYQWEKTPLEVELLLLDEAHHLKRSWAEAVLSLKAQLPTLMTISLTATPPFDSEAADWARYLEVSGAIDGEISIPSLVKEDVLAPHQDFVYLIPGTTEMQASYVEHERSQEALFQLILEDDELRDYLINCQFIQAPLEALATIYESFAVYQSALIYLWHRNYDLGEAHWQLLGVSKKQGEAIGVPPVTTADLEVIANYVAKQAPELAISQLVNQKRLGQEHWVNLFAAFPLSPQQNPLGKKQGIRQIIMREVNQLQADLSAVILVDFIKAEGITGDSPSFGLFPLFNYLSELCYEEDLELAAICGDWLVVSKPLYEERFADLEGERYPNNQDYVLLPIKERRSHILEDVTALVNQKKIQVLIGTVALLGEGWDCPAVNCLILGNQGHGFVQTQQLRGRSLRKAAGKEASTIWHLGMVLVEVEAEKQVGLKRLSKRLAHIAGITFEQDGVIETGAERFEFPLDYQAQTIENYNEKMLFWSSQKAELSAQWQKALSKGSHLRQAVMTRYEGKPKSLKKKRTFQKDARFSVVVTFALVALPVSFLAISPLAALGGAVVSSALGGALAQREKIQQRWSRFQAEREWQKTIKTWHLGAKSVYDTLVDLHLVTSSAKVKVVSTSQEISCTLEGGLKKEEALFNRGVEELLQELATPRYLLHDDQQCWPVPTIFGQNQQAAQVFMANWQKQFKQKVTLSYTKSQQGRRLLIQHKLKALTNDQTSEIIRKDLWSN